MNTATQKDVESGLFSPHTYFRTRNNLYIWGTFEDRILSGQKESIPYRGLEGVTSHLLERDVSDREIINEILDGMNEVLAYAFTLDQVAAKIDLQPNGEDGELLNNGYANIFYVFVDGILFAVHVFWNSFDGRWFVSAWHLDEEDDWGAGCRVFRNTI